MNITDDTTFARIDNFIVKDPKMVLRKSMIKDNPRSIFQS